MEVIGTHGKFEQERDGRLSGTVIRIDYPRKDGKYPVLYAFGSGKRIRKLYTQEQCETAINQLSGGTNPASG